MPSAATARHNWAGNVTFSAADFHRPTSIPELQTLVARGARVRTLGSGHSFSPIADTTGDLISVAGLPPLVELDTEGSSVRVSAGTRYGELGAVLQSAGFALPNTGSLPHISIAGATATGTHGSGNANGNLATVVSEIEIVTADGDLRTLSRDQHGERFNGMVLALGLLGVVTTLTLRMMPTFSIRQDVYDDLPHAELLENFPEISDSAYSVSVFSTWREPRVHSVWRKSHVAFTDTTTAQAPAAQATLHSAGLATATRHPLGPGFPADSVTDQLGVPGPWNERLPHFRLEFTPSAGAELQTEYLVARGSLPDALTALEDITADVARVLQVSELRTVAADDLWLSPSYRRDSACLHFTWVDDTATVTPVVAAIEHRLRPFDARPHWGKVFSTGSDVIDGLYERLPDFRTLAAEFDPDGKFGNAMTDSLIFQRPRRP